MKCLTCNKRSARKHPVYGALPCLACSKKQQGYSVAPTIELTTSDIKYSRKVYNKEILQRYRGDTPSLEYIKAYGRKGFSNEEVKRAKNVWGNYYENKTERGKDYLREKK